MIARLLAATGTALVVMSAESAVAAEGDGVEIPGSFSVIDRRATT